ATGGSALATLEIVHTAGAEHVRLVSVVAAPEGVQALHVRFPATAVYTAVLDRGLNARKFILPGLGDFGDRYFGTDREAQGGPGRSCAPPPWREDQSVDTPWNAYMQVGLVHFMMYPEAMAGGDDALQSIEALASDPLFEVLEITRINNPAVREQVRQV